MYIVVAILFFGILILAHELGHFSAAKWNGIGVYEFNFGMGPKLLTKRYKETDYSLRLFPIGGSVLMVGEDEESLSPVSFNSKKVWQRMSVIFAGPFMNFIVAIAAFIVVFMMLGVTSSSNIVVPSSGRPAEAAGLLSGDAVVAVNGQAVSDWESLSAAIRREASGGMIEIKVNRKGELLTFRIDPYYDEASDNYYIGIVPSTETVGFFRAVSMGFRQTYEFTKLLLVTLAQMISGKVAPEVAGPVGIVTIVGEAASMGLSNLLILLGVLSINLGVINLLPIPAMDGSRLVFLAIEGVRGKPFDRKKEGFVHFVGLMLLFGLMIVITYQDILRIIKG